MTRINVYRSSTVLSKFFIVFGSIFTLSGILLLIQALIKGFNIHFPSGDWNSVTFTIQGLLFIIMGVGNLSVRKYFIEWDDKELIFFLPDTKKLEKVNFADIISVNIRLFEIELNLQNQIKILDLNTLQFEDLKKIKAKFETFKKI
jgi:hypothetical protein